MDNASFAFMAERTLYGLGYSPWSEKARWALDHHGVEYTYHEHVPMLGEPLLRLKAGRLTGRVSVPMLVDDAGVTLESFEIARRAEALGSGAKLFPEEQLDEIRRWNRMSDQVMEAGRVLVIQRTLASEEAQRDALPKLIPSGARGSLAFMARSGTKFLAKKYGVSNASADDARSSIADALEALRRALEKGPRLTGEFSYADIVMAAAIQMVKPVDDAYVRLSPVTREVWTEPKLAQRFVDLVAWRDEVYRRHRRRVH